MCSSDAVLPPYPKKGDGEGARADHSIARLFFVENVAFVVKKQLAGYDGVIRRAKKTSKFACNARR